MRTKKLNAKQRETIRNRMTSEQRSAEDRAKLAILNDFRARHGLPTLNAKDAGLED